jgi:vancomycin permeability regulator SanA
VAARGGTLQAYVREIGASWKALFDLLMKRQPKYLGAPTPLAGYAPKETAGMGK